MSRPLRLKFPGATYHVFARGNAREAIFHDDRDRRAFLGILKDVVAHYRLRCHAYCLMGTHYHSILETAEANVSAAMRQLNGVYAQYLNRRHARTGHVFEGRFKSSLIDRTTYLLEAARYVVLNPVRAGLVARPEDWLWSSYRAAAGLARVPASLTVDDVLSLLSPDASRARELYRGFVADGMNDGITQTAWEPVRGSARFVRGLAPRLRAHAREREFPRRERFVARPSLAEIFEAAQSRGARASAIRSARHRHGYLLREIGAHLGLHYSTIAKIAGVRS